MLLIHAGLLGCKKCILVAGMHRQVAIRYWMRSGLSVRSIWKVRRGWLRYHLGRDTISLIFAVMDVRAHVSSFGEVDGRRFRIISISSVSSTPSIPQNTSLFTLLPTGNILNFSFHCLAGHQALKSSLTYLGIRFLPSTPGTCL